MLVFSPLGLCRELQYCTSNSLRKVGLEPPKKNKTNSVDAAEGTWFATFDGHHQNGGKEADLWDFFFFQGPETKIS